MNTFNFRKYIGRPYEEYNCFDLVKEFYFDVFGVTLKNYFEGDVPDRREVESLIIANKGDFVKVADKKLGDIILLKLYGIECHMGVLISPSQFLHSAKNVGSILDRVERYSHVIGGVYRLVDRQS